MAFSYRAVDTAVRQIHWPQSTTQQVHQYAVLPVPTQNRAVFQVVHALPVQRALQELALHHVAVSIGVTADARYRSVLQLANVLRAIGELEHAVAIWVSSPTRTGKGLVD